MKAASVGTFDGVHMGHRLVLDTLRNLAHERGLAPVAVTFDRHPLQVIAPERTPGMLTTLSEKVSLIAATGVSPEVICFTDSVRHLTACRWMRRMHDEMGVKMLLVGYDNTFGSDGLSMSVADYADIGRDLGIEVVQAPELPGISSSAIRRAVNNGDIAAANRMLGRPYALTGTVVHGQGLGHRIGFATANLEPSANLSIPANGVYAAEAITADGNRRGAMVNIGLRPTAGVFEAPTVEAHILDYQGDIYDDWLRLEFVERLRDEVRFPSLDALKKQLADDALATRKIFQQNY